jgi:RNA polymerase sigma-70 factor (ECF subfamily)
LLKRGSEEAFCEIYERYWEKLYRYVFNRTSSPDVAFEMTQNVFVSLWKRRQEVAFHTSLSGYLFASVRYGIIRYVRSARLKEDYFKDFTVYISYQRDNSSEDKINLRQLEEAIEASVMELPERCREIFRMSRYQNMSIKEIAGKLGISHKTVENQLTAALKHLRKSLGDFMLVPLLYLIDIFI